MLAPAPQAALVTVGNIRPGEYLIAVDGAKIDGRTNLDQLLAYKIGRRVVLSVAATHSAQPREVVVRPVNGGTEKGLLYRRWIEANRAYVARISNGRLGYVHMPDMSSGALSQLNVDLDAENQKHD